MTVTIDAIYDGRVLTPQTPLHLKANAHYRITIDDTPSVQPVAHVLNFPPDAVNPIDDEAAAVLTIYDNNIKALLEPAQNGKIVAIHLESEDYEVAERSIDAWKVLKARHPDGHIVAMDIGPVSKYDSLELRRKGLLRSEVKTS